MAEVYTQSRINVSSLSHRSDLTSEIFLKIATVLPTNSWNETPSRKSGISSATELSYILECFHHLCCMDKHAANSTHVIALAKNILIRYVQVNTFAEFNRIVVSLSCYFVASKCLDFFIDIMALVKYYYKNQIEKHMNCPHFPPEQSKQKQIKDVIFKTEIKILTDLGFDVNMQLPYSYIDAYKELMSKNTGLSAYFEISGNIDKIRSTSLMFLEHILGTPAILYCSPLMLATCSIDFALNYWYKIEYNNDMRMELYKLLCPSINESELLEVHSIVRQWFEEVYSKKMLREGMIVQVGMDVVVKAPARV